jgi:hypothetical protein
MKWYHDPDVPPNRCIRKPISDAMTTTTTAFPSPLCGFISRPAVVIPPAPLTVVFVLCTIAFLSVEVV